MLRSLAWFLLRRITQHKPVFLALRMSLTGKYRLVLNVLVLLFNAKFVPGIKLFWLWWTLSQCSIYPYGMFDIHSCMKRSIHMGLKRFEWKEPTSAFICISATHLCGVHHCTFHIAVTKKLSSNSHTDTLTPDAYAETYKVKTIPARLSLLVKWFYTTLKDMQITLQDVFQCKVRKERTQTHRRLLKPQF